MSYLVIVIDNSIIDLFVQQTEDFYYCRYQIREKTPYLLCYEELYRLFGYLPKKFSYCFIVAEALSDTVLLSVSEAEH